MADLTDLTSGEIVDDPIVPPERPASTPLAGMEIQNARPAVNTGDALDRLAAGKTGAAAPAADSDVEDPIAKAADEARVKADAKAKEDAKKKTDAAKKDTTAPAKKDVAAPAATEPTEAEKKAAADAKAKEDAATARAAEPKDDLSKVELPPYVKPATVTAFDKVKAVARETISKLTKELETAKAAVPANGGLTPALQKEFDRYRDFYAVHNYRGTPEFVDTYEKPIASNDEVILAKLKDSGFTDEQLTQIKQIGTAKLDWDPVLEKLPTVARRSIEAKLLENESLVGKRDKALKEAEGKPGEYAKKQEEDTKRRSAEEIATTKTTAEAIIEQGGLFKLKDIPVSATSEEKAALEAENKFIETQKQRYEQILADRSPGMIGQLIASTLLAYKFKGEADSWKSRAETAEAEVAKIRKASTSRRESAAPNGGPIPKRDVSILRDTTSALDALYKEKVGARD